MRLQPILNSNYKYQNFRSKNSVKETSLELKDFTDLALAVGLFTNIDYFSDFKKGSNREKFGKAAILSAVFIDWGYSMYKSYKNSMRS